MRRQQTVLVTALMLLGATLVAYGGLWNLGLAPGSRITIPEPVALQRAGGVRDVSLTPPVAQAASSRAMPLVSDPVAANAPTPGETGGVTGTPDRSTANVAPATPLASALVLASAARRGTTSVLGVPPLAHAANAVVPTATVIPGTVEVAPAPGDGAAVQPDGAGVQPTPHVVPAADPAMGATDPAVVPTDPTSLPADPAVQASDPAGAVVQAVATQGGAVDPSVGTVAQPTPVPGNGGPLIPVGSPVPGYALRLTIPSIHLDTPVEQAGLIQDANGQWAWETRPFVAVHYGDLTALVGAPGNAVIAGHVATLYMGNVFQRLDQVNLGDAVQVYDDQGQIQQWIVTRVHLVSPDDTSVMDPTPEPTLTLITCGGTFDPVAREFSDRLVVVASPVPPATPNSAP